ncbi:MULTISPECIES: hypothetical protein [unclassified Streptomyces]|uniref:hypothetical protein n=1 Tax=unclassified Streptomyces TaxID=2593676 RepID=UPI000B87BEB7|nr:MULTISPECIES: hypothetical protein [unclassified Streptomyces]MYZ35547.1 hypothetical protein [Streptomyces sp. SID4917]
MRSSTRLRTTLVASVGVLALLAAVPGSASAAQGEFRYVFTGMNGGPTTGMLVNPGSRECVTLPEVAGEYVPPAHSPSNRTSSTATVFTGPDCDGDYYTLRPGGSASSRLLLRSVVFS